MKHDQYISYIKTDFVWIQSVVKKLETSFGEEICSSSTCDTIIICNYASDCKIAHTIMHSLFQNSFLINHVDKILEIYSGHGESLEIIKWIYSFSTVNIL